MPATRIVYGVEEKTLEAQSGDLLGDVILQSGFPFEQPCAGRGTCGLCKVIDEGGLQAKDEIEAEHLKAGEIAIGNRLACRARIEGDTTVILTPVVVYSNKVFQHNDRYKRERNAPLGLAVDLGTTTVAAYLTMLEDGEVCGGAASLNQQAVYGADLISRLAAAVNDAEHARRLQDLARASISQAVDALHLPRSVQRRIGQVSIVANPAMHHLLAGLPVNSLALMPFQPHDKQAIEDGYGLLDGLLPKKTRVSMPPLVGGFVGSDALACLAYFDFDRRAVPIAAIDMGTNGEVLCTDGKRILTASTAAGPAFEGVNVSCGSRAVDGAVTRVWFEGDDVKMETIADEEPVGLTGTGLISAIHACLQKGLVEASGRIAAQTEQNAKWITEIKGQRSILLDKTHNLFITQKDVRELQKAKAAIRAALEVLLRELDLDAKDLHKLYLTGSFGASIDVGDMLAIGLVPLVEEDVIETQASAAGLGAALFLSEEGKQRAKVLAEHAEQIDLDMDKAFMDLFVGSMGF